VSFCFETDINQASGQNIHDMGEMISTALQRELKIKEVPITLVGIIEGVAKMSATIFRKAFFGVFIIRGEEL